MYKTMITDKMTPQDCERAWELWNNVEEFSQMLWEFFENYFIDRCMDEEDFEEMDRVYESYYNQIQKGETNDGN